jgi:hypothetical protein
MEPDRFTTLDVYLAAYLSLNGCRIALEVQSGKVIFVFSQSREVNQFLEKFNSNTPVAVADFATAVKTLRGRMLQAKGCTR